MQNDFENNIERISSEEDDFYTNDDIFKFNSWGADLSFRELIDRYKNGELLKPELQRHYVWDKIEASRFIDSILLGLPIPSIFLAKRVDEILLIIDGYQRIMTVYDYVNGIFSKDGKVFKLSNSSKINDRWKGKAFSELSDIEQRKIKSTTIHAIIFVQTHPSKNETGMYQVFERINTSGRTLFPQEIRNCIYQGSLNRLLFKLNNNKIWRELFGCKEADARMRDLEYILRFLAMRKMDFKKMKMTAISLKLELNLFMGDEQNNIDKNINSFENDFIETIEKVYSMFKGNAFRNISKKYPEQLVEKFNPTIFDSIMLATASVKKIKADKNWENKRRSLLQNQEYQNAISIRTTNIDNIKKRIELAKKYLFK